jgi:hypothetical protein
MGLDMSFFEGQTFRSSISSKLPQVVRNAMSVRSNADQFYAAVGLEITEMILRLSQQSQNSPKKTRQNPLCLSNGHSEELHNWTEPFAS